MSNRNHDVASAQRPTDARAKTDVAVPGTDPRPAAAWRDYLRSMAGASGRVPGRQAPTSARDKTGGEAPAGSAAVAAAFDEARSGGAVELPFQSDLEAAFGEDLSGVQAFTGQSAPLAAMGARAAARGDEVVFASARPDRATVAHEVAHVVQQRAGGGAGPTVASRPGDATEREADAAARAVESGQSVPALAPAPGGVQGDWITDWFGADEEEPLSSEGAGGNAGYDYAYDEESICSPSGAEEAGGGADYEEQLFAATEVDDTGAEYDYDDEQLCSTTETADTTASSDHADLGQETPTELPNEQADVWFSESGACYERDPSAGPAVYVSPTTGVRYDAETGLYSACTRDAWDVFGHEDEAVAAATGTGADSGSDPEVVTGADVHVSESGASYQRVEGAEGEDLCFSEQTGLWYDLVAGLYYGWTGELWDTFGSEEEALEALRATGETELLGGGTWIVGEQDSLWSIAEATYGDGGYWGRIMESNPDLVGPVGEVLVGTTLVLPEVPVAVACSEPPIEAPAGGGRRPALTCVAPRVEVPLDQRVAFSLPGLRGELRVTGKAKAAAACSINPLTLTPAGYNAALRQGIEGLASELKMTMAGGQVSISSKLTGPVIATSLGIEPPRTFVYGASKAFSTVAPSSIGNLTVESEVGLEVRLTPEEEVPGGPATVSAPSIEAWHVAVALGAVAAIVFLPAVAGAAAAVGAKGGAVTVAAAAAILPLVAAEWGDAL